MILLFQKLEMVEIRKIETQAHVATAFFNERCLKMNETQNIHFLKKISKSLNDYSNLIGKCLYIVPSVTHWGVQSNDKDDVFNQLYNDV